MANIMLNLEISPFSCENTVIQRRTQSWFQTMYFGHAFVDHNIVKTHDKIIKNNNIMGLSVHCIDLVYSTRFSTKSRTAYCY